MYLFTVFTLTPFGVNFVWGFLSRSGFKSFWFIKKPTTFITFATPKEIRDSHISSRKYSMTQRDGLEIINGIDSPLVNCFLTSSKYKTRLDNSLSYHDRATLMRAY